MFAEWSPARAESLARGAGLPALGDRHWKVIASAREEAARRGRAPHLRRLEELTGFATAELQVLFPGETEALITRIAGCESGYSGHGPGAAAPPKE